MTYDAFISYRRASSASQARLLKKELADRGYRIFLDVTDLQKGYFDQKLLTTISETPNFLLVLAPGSLENLVEEDDWLRAELREAIRTKRNIVPVCLPGFEFPRAMPADLADLARHQAVEWSNTLFDATIDRILAAIGKPRSVRMRLGVGLAAAAGVAAATALYFAGTHRYSAPSSSVTLTPLVEPKEGAVIRPEQGQRP